MGAGAGRACVHARERGQASTTSDSSIGRRVRESSVAHADRIAAAGFDCIKTEHLYEFDGTRAYSLGQGE